MIPGAARRTLTALVVTVLGGVTACAPSAAGPSGAAGPPPSPGLAGDASPTAPQEAGRRASLMPRQPRRSAAPISEAPVPADSQRPRPEAVVMGPPTPGVYRYRTELAPQPHTSYFQVQISQVAAGEFREVTSRPGSSASFTRWLSYDRTGLRLTRTRLQAPSGDQTCVVQPAALVYPRLVALADTFATRVVCGRDPLNRDRVETTRTRVSRLSVPRRGAGPLVTLDARRQSGNASGPFAPPPECRVVSTFSAADGLLRDQLEVCDGARIHRVLVDGPAA